MVGVVRCWCDLLCLARLVLLPDQRHPPRLHGRPPDNTNEGREEVNPAQPVDTVDADIEFSAREPAEAALVEAAVHVGDPVLVPGEPRPGQGRPELARLLHTEPVQVLVCPGPRADGLQLRQRRPRHPRQTPHWGPHIPLTSHKITHSVSSELTEKWFCPSRMFVLQAAE